ncbi:MAG: bifunctional 3-phenylpropionate/cinnamic acid dioxygenase ferredoxin subunit [Galactobacter sp.]
MQGIDVAGVEEIPEGEALAVEAVVDGVARDIAIFHTEDGEFYALDDECTHETASLADGWIEDDRVECPLHAAEFCLRTGKAMCMPATVDARTHVVEVVDGRVLLHPGESVADAVRK